MNATPIKDSKSLQFDPNFQISFFQLSNPHESTIRAVAKIIKGNNIDSKALDSVSISERFAEQLFPGQTLSDHDDSRYFVCIGDYVYRVVTAKWLQDTQLLVNPFQFKEISVGFSHKNKMVVSPFDVRQVRDLTSVEIALSYHINEGFPQQELRVAPQLIDESRLKQLIIANCRHHVVRMNQKICIKLENGLIITAPLKFKQDASGPHSEYGLLKSSTAIKFIKKFEQIQFFDLVTWISKTDRLFFSLQVTDSKSHSSSESISFKRSRLIAYVNNLLHDKEIALGQTFDFEFAGHTLRMVFEKINDKAFDSSSHEPEKNQTAYKKSVECSIDFKIASPNVFLRSDSPKTTSKAHLKILEKLSTTPSIDPIGPNWISEKDLYIAIEGKIVVNREIIKIRLHQNDYLIYVTGMGSEDQPEHQTYILNKKNASSIELPVGFQLVPTSQTWDVEKVTLTIKPKPKPPSSPFQKHIEDDIKEDIKGINSSDLTRAFNNIGYPIYENAVIKLDVNGIKVEFLVADMNLRPKEALKPVDGSASSSSSNTSATPQETPPPHSLGVINAKTRFSYKNNASTTGIEVLVPDEAIPDTETLLKELKTALGGLENEFHTICDIVTQSRGDLSEEAKKRGMSPVRGLLLYGPPGTGKTSIGNLISKLLKCKSKNIKKISASDVLNKWVGETEKNIRELFAAAQKDWDLYGEKSDLHLLLIDEIDSILPNREHCIAEHTKSFVNQFLAKLDGFDQMHNLFVIGITNRKNAMDPAALRHGRFGRHLYIPLPDESGRKEIFQIYTKTSASNKLLAADVDYDFLARHTNKASGADIKGLVELASSFSLARLDALKLSQHEMQLHPSRMITMDDFKGALIQQRYYKPERRVLGKIWGKREH